MFPLVLMVFRADNSWHFLVSGWGDPAGVIQPGWSWTALPVRACQFLNTMLPVIRASAPPVARFGLRLSTMSPRSDFFSLLQLSGLEGAHSRTSSLRLQWWSWSVAHPR